MSIHSCSGTEAGSHAVPEPACDEGNCIAGPCSSICIPPMEVSCAEARHKNIATTTEYVTSEYEKALTTKTSFLRRNELTTHELTTHRLTTHQAWRKTCARWDAC